MTTVREQLNAVIATIVTNREHIASQIQQLEQQLSIQKDQYETAATLVASLQHLLEINADEAITSIAMKNALAAAEVASSPSTPAAANS